MLFSPDDAFDWVTDFATRLASTAPEDLSGKLGSLSLELHSLVRRVEHQANERAAEIAKNWEDDYCASDFIAEAILKLNEPPLPSPEEGKMISFGPIKHWVPAEASYATALVPSEAWNKHKADPKKQSEHDALWIKRTIKARDKAGHAAWDKATTILDSSAGDMPQPWRNAAIELLAEHHPDIIINHALTTFRCVAHSIREDAPNHKNMMKMAIQEMERLSLDDPNNIQDTCEVCAGKYLNHHKCVAQSLGPIRITNATQFFTHNCVKCSEPQYSRADDATLSDYREAVSGNGPRAYDWKDKPHRLVYDLINKVKEHQTANENIRQKLAKIMEECPQWVE